MLFSVTAVNDSQGDSRAAPSLLFRAASLSSASPSTSEPEPSHWQEEKEKARNSYGMMKGGLIAGTI
eukprot:1105138-Rhodomonas_salina.2